MQSSPQKTRIPDRKGKVAAGAYEILRQKIMQNQLPGNSYVLEEEIARDLEISRTPVREALTRLEAEGLIQAVPRHGYKVVPITMVDIAEIYQVLSPLETVAAELLATKPDNSHEVAILDEAVNEMRMALERDDLDGWAAADERFHTCLVELCGNNRLAKAAKMLFAQSHRVRIFTLRLRDKPIGSVEKHAALVDAIRKRSPDLAREVHNAQRDAWTSSMTNLFSKLGVHQV
ncbi:GntR family transcriptional regulator (plasmid) [Cupriavidus pinatubonensis]|uniref:GntR family transcriptional regulator n=1 Tax=Cupriavidus pinatubonensis TaxID=248026 RepID=UPI001C73D7E4|nr:GntR family transcriptional regulator [Cupriavidus pinatubonensis]QYY33796.1 GntR family transcriptional regulator [Cupriavidus pinatubonensis]